MASISAILVNKHCILYFYVRDCPYCHKLDPVITSLEYRYPNIKLVRLEVGRYANSETTKFIRENKLSNLVTSVPTIFTSVQGSIRYQGSGFSYKGEIIVDQIVDRIVDQIFDIFSKEKESLTLKLEHNKRYLYWTLPHTSSIRLLALLRDIDCYFSFLPKDLLSVIYCCLVQKPVSDKELRKIFE